MKIAFYIPYYSDGGVETTTTRLARCFRDRGHRVDLLTFGHDDTMLGADSPFSVVDLGASRTLTSIPSLVRYLRTQRPDALISLHYYVNICAVLGRTISRTDTALILTERLALSAALEEESGLKARVFPELVRLAYPRAEKRVGVSQGVVAHLADEAGLPRDSLAYIYNPTLVDEIFERAEEPVDHSWFHDDIPVVLGVGRLADQKDFETLVRAFARVRSDREARLIILGEGENRADLEALVDHLGLGDSVDLHGYVDNPYSYMRAADLFVLSSRYEGMPNVLVEAMAIGTPVVSTDCPVGPRELLGDEDVAPLVDVGDVDGMAAGILDQLSDLPAASERLERVEGVLDEFTPSTACERYLSLIEDARTEV